MPLEDPRPEERPGKPLSPHHRPPRHKRHYKDRPDEPPMGDMPPMSGEPPMREMPPAPGEVPMRDMPPAPGNPHGEQQPPHEGPGFPR